ncbi:MAG: rhomboid family intramembrane serine protease [Bacteroidales bacterium]
MSEERKHIIQSLLPPMYLIALLWVIKLGEIVSGFDLHFLGVFPLNFSGILGILTSPLIHSDIKHLAANSVPLFVLGASLLYFYKEIALKSLALIYVLPGLFVWFGGREAFHIGASGVVYGLAGFLFFSGVFRKEARLLAITLLVTFLYGSLIWGIFPGFYPEEKISFESHFWGLIAGIIVAFYFRKQGPQRKKYNWEIEEEDQEDVPETNSQSKQENITINYIPPSRSTL